MARGYETIIPDDTPWLKQVNESGAAFKAFELYRDAEPKISAQQAADILGRNVNTVKKWCAVNLWKSRREAWISYQSKLVVDELLQGIPKMRKTHADIASTMLIKAMKALKAMPVETMLPRDVSTMVDIATKLERISRGEATEKTENRTTISGDVSIRGIDLSKLTEEELKNLDELADKISPE
jgi:hypothetical protein